MKKNIFFLLYILAQLFHYDVNDIYAAYSPSQSPASCVVAHEVTIFVHGMLNIAPHMTWKNIYLFAKDDILDTLYAHTVHHMRNDPFFYVNDGMGPMGLEKLDIHNFTKGMTAHANAYIYNEMSRMSGLAHEHHHYYTYGWSGLFSMRQRYEEAEGFLHSIHMLTEQYTYRGVSPKIRIIAYSHGGNVALNIAAVYCDKYPTMQVCVDELIIIGTPIQEATDLLAESPLFKKIYNFYSRLDRIQQIDIFSINRLFSGQCFEDRPSFKVPSKITQVQVKCSRMHKNYKQRQPIPMDIHAESKKSGQRRTMRDASPGHIELWFFGWTLSNYRGTFPLAPLSVLSFVPYMIAQLRKVEANQKVHHPYPIIFDMRPDYGISVIKQRNNPEMHVVVPFISVQDLEPLHCIARDIQSEEYTKKGYKTHLQEIFDYACTDYNVNKKKLGRPSKRAHRRRLRRLKKSNLVIL